MSSVLRTQDQDRDPQLRKNLFREGEKTVVKGMNVLLPYPFDYRSWAQGVKVTKVLRYLVPPFRKGELRSRWEHTTCRYEERVYTFRDFSFVQQKKVTTYGLLELHYLMS